jgi:hypothetical protein
MEILTEFARRWKSTQLMKHLDFTDYKIKDLILMQENQAGC